MAQSSDEEIRSTIFTLRASARRLAEQASYLMEKAAKLEDKLSRRNDVEHNRFRRPPAEPDRDGNH